MITKVKSNEAVLDWWIGKEIRCQICGFVGIFEKGDDARRSFQRTDGAFSQVFWECACGNLLYVMKGTE